MPTYDYECDTCGNIEELFINLDSFDQPVFCEKCDSLMRRIVGCHSFQLKGGCWERDDYKRMDYYNEMANYEDKS